MHSAAVGAHTVKLTFGSSDPRRLPMPWWEECQAIIREVLANVRPTGEHWTVTAHAVGDQTLLRFDFARGSDAPHWFTFDAASDDASHRAYRKVLSQFLRVTWPERKPAYVM